MRRELTKMLAFVVFSSLAAVALAGCNAGMCARNSDCKAGQMCTVDGVCAARSDDGDGDDDAATTDASVETADASEATASDAPIDAE